MEFQLNDFEDGKPLKLKSTEVTKTIKELRSKQKYKEMFQLAETLEGYQKFLVKANALFYMNQNEEVLKACDQGLKIREQSQFYNLKCRVYGKQGKFRDKIKNAELALALDPNVPAYHRNKGAGLYKMKEYQNAIACHTRAIQLQPNNAVNYHNRGAAYFRMGNFQEAKKHFQQAIKLDPKLGLAYGWLGNSNAELKNDEEALKSYQKAYQITNNPEYKEKIKAITKKIKKENGTESVWDKIKGVFD